MFRFFMSRAEHRPIAGFHLDIPAGGRFLRCSRNIRVSGWYADPDGRAAERIFLRIGRRTVPCGTCWRPDVVEALAGRVKDANCGFEASFTTRPGWKRVRVYAQEKAGGLRLLATRFFHFRSPPFPKSISRADEARVRREKRSELQRDLAAFLDGRRTLGFSVPSERPALSVLIVLWNQAELTLACLQSLQRALADIDAEILIADNASSDATPQLLASLSGPRIFYRTSNEGFLMAANFLAGEARGEHLLFLNNDATVEPDAVRRALASLHRRPKIGAVGAKVILPHGVVQEAGNTIWRDGSGLGYGRNLSPADPGVLDWKYTDYVSGVFLLTRRADFMSVGGFDPSLAPAYCEDVDYCIKLWRNGLAVVYDPSVVVHHFELGSSVNTESTMALMARNAEVLRRKHGDWLAGQPVLRPGLVESRFCRFSAYRGHVLLMDDCVPDFHTGAGAPRTVALVEALLEKNWKITFCATLDAGPAPEWFHVRFGSEVRIINAVDRAVFESWMKRYRDTLDVVFVSRPHNMAAFGALLSSGREIGGRPKLVYDAEAIYALRDIAAAALRGAPLADRQAAQRVEAEIGLAACADAVVAVSPLEAGWFLKRYANQKPVEILAHTLGVHPARVTGFAARSGLLFVGRLSDEGSPNVDSMLWFIREVYPLLEGKIDGPIRIVGDARALPAAMRRLPGIEIMGMIDDVTPYYEQARVFIAPTRFAAGIPLKVIEAARHHLPAVCTSLLAGQLEWRHECEVLVADTAEGFARECRRLHDDPGLWASLSREVAARYDEQFSTQCFAGAVERIFSPIAAPSAVT